LVAGKYTLVEVIGEGGMGAVWRARQTEPVKRFVAVKLIKPGMDSKQVLARFEAERQALALMDHPNIAKVLDGGLHEGRPFFVMELVKGVPITDYCDARRLTPRQRLELFVPVCQAIQHAHQKGVIHRDIKPSNVLVALYDDRPVIKVIDFGVAKATGGTLTEHTIDTGFGGVVGTPEYMSPEQATFNNLDIDTRSDVYALGVRPAADVYGLGAILYELLTGRPPFQGETPLLTLEQVVADEPLAPSRLRPRLPRDLVTICLKCLRKEPHKRYATSEALADDLGRFLRGEPLRARPAGAPERLGRWCRRNPTVASLGAALAVILVGSVVALTGLYLNADAQRCRAEGAEENWKSAAEDARKSEADVKAVLDFFKKRVLAAARPKGRGADGIGLGPEATIREAVDAAEPRIAAACRANGFRATRRIRTAASRCRCCTSRTTPWGSSAWSRRPSATSEGDCHDAWSAVQRHP
jgi:hypothetical protein